MIAEGSGVSLAGFVCKESVLVFSRVLARDAYLTVEFEPCICAPLIIVIMLELVVGQTSSR